MKFCFSSVGLHNGKRQIPIRHRPRWHVHRHICQMSRGQDPSHETAISGSCELRGRPDGGYPQNTRRGTSRSSQEQNKKHTDEAAKAYRVFVEKLIRREDFSKSIDQIDGTARSRESILKLLTPFRFFDVTDVKTSLLTSCFSNFRKPA